MTLIEESMYSYICSHIITGCATHADNHYMVYEWVSTIMYTVKVSYHDGAVF